MSDELAPTGITGLDEILRGGLPPHQMYIIQGDPGACTFGGVRFAPVV